MISTLPSMTTETKDRTLLAAMQRLNGAEESLGDAIQSMREAMGCPPASPAGDAPTGPACEACLGSGVLKNQDKPGYTIPCWRCTDPSYLKTPGESAIASVVEEEMPKWVAKPLASYRKYVEAVGDINESPVNWIHGYVWLADALAKERQARYDAESAASDLRNEYEQHSVTVEEAVLKEREALLHAVETMYVTTASPNEDRLVAMIKHAIKAAIHAGPPSEHA